MKRTLSIFISVLILQISTFRAVVSIPAVLVPIGVVTLQDKALSQDKTTKKEVVDKSHTITIILSFFGGLEYFYLGHFWTGILYLFLDLFGVGELLSLYDFLCFISMDDEEWHSYLESGEAIPGWGW